MNYPRRKKCARRERRFAPFPFFTALHLTTLPRRKCSGYNATCAHSSRNPSTHIAPRQDTPKTLFPFSPALPSACSAPRSNRRAPRRPQSSRELDILLLDRDALRVNSAQIRIVEQIDEERFGGFLQREQSLRLPAIRAVVTRDRLSDFAHLQHHTHQRHALQVHPLTAAAVQEVNSEGCSEGSSEGSSKDKTHQSLKRQLQQQQVRRLLVLAYLAQRNCAWLVPLGALRRGPRGSQALSAVATAACGCASAAAAGARFVLAAGA